MLAAAHKDKADLVTERNPSSKIFESYRALRTNLQYSTTDSPPKTVLFTSVKANDQKSVTLSNLAVVYAREGKQVLVIDADLRNPQLHNSFTSNGLGLANVLLGQVRIADVISESQIPNLSFISAGHIPPNPSELLSMERMQSILSEARGRFDIVLIDSPPVLTVSDAQILAAACDGVVVTIQQGKVKREVARKALDQLNYVKAIVLGVVLVNMSK